MTMDTLWILADTLTPLAELKKKVETGYFEGLVRKYLLDNPHKAFVNLYPEQGKNERAEAELKRQLAHIKGTLDKKQLYFLTEQTRKVKRVSGDAVHTGGTILRFLCWNCPTSQRKPFLIKTGRRSSAISRR